MIIGDILVYYTNIFAYLIWFGVIADTAFNFFLPSGAGDWALKSRLLNRNIDH